jgi:hypothetical protein
LSDFKGLFSELSKQFSNYSLPCINEEVYMKSKSDDAGNEIKNIFQQYLTVRDLLLFIYMYLGFGEDSIYQG